MTRLWRATFITLATLPILLAIGIAATVGWRPILGPRARPLTDRAFVSTPARLERGRYLVESVNGCLFCHSDNDSANHLRPKPGTEGAGRNMAFEFAPFLNSSNITSDRATGAGSWSDDALARAIREGIGHDGRALFPMMPYEGYRAMSDEDLASVIVYIRSLAAIRRPTPASAIPFPVNRLINAVPEPVDTPVAAPNGADPVTRGKYLVTIGGCRDCHTPRDSRDQRIPGLDYAGGQPTKGSAREVASANLTPDPSGIPYYDETLFVNAMRSGFVGAREVTDAMPWPLYGKMTEEDLRAVFTYLKTLKPVQHRIDNDLAPTDCPRCGHKHGGGDKNKALTD